MPQIVVTVTGLDKAQLRLDRYHGPVLDRSLQKATMAAGRTLVRPMKRAAPVAKEPKRGKYAHEPGMLRNSVKATKARRGDKPGAIVGPRAWYRHFTIVGTYGGSRVPANPWVTNAAEANRETATRKFETTLHAELTRR